jgi:phosphoribosylaminoimidazolecarboxamide formyltransferase/IMP cyclohydrolase
MSFNNWLDASAGVSLVREFKKPAAAIIKHGVPAGIALENTVHKAFLKAWASDPQSAFGSVIAFNQSCDQKTAETIVSFFNEVVLAPKIEKNALRVFSKKKALRVIELKNWKEKENKWEARSLEGGMLVQEKDILSETQKTCRVVSKKTPAPKQWNDLWFAFKVAKHVKSNAIVVAKNEVVLGIGTGQTSRVLAVQHALEKASKQSVGAVLASDAFFPFQDNIERVARAGIKALMAPGGSKRDPEIIQAANQAGLALVFAFHRHFKH